MGARSDRWEDFVDLGGREDEADVIWRLLDELEQRIESGSRDHVGLVDDVDLVARRRRSEHRALTQVSSVVDSAMARSVQFDDID